MICKKFIITGRVQGVYYRASLRKEAIRLGLCGHVMNQSDGSVMAIVQGEAAQIAALEKWCWAGPPMAAVVGVEVQEEDVEENFVGFEIRR